MAQISLIKEINRRHALSMRAEINNSQRLLDVLTLNDALWTATGVDITSLAMDKTFLAYLDGDNNGRILCGEVRYGLAVLVDCLVDLDDAFEDTAAVRLDKIREDTPRGLALRESAERLLSTKAACNQVVICGETDSMSEVSLESVRFCKELLKEKTVSEEGVILPETTETPGLQVFLKNVIHAVDGVPHPSGAMGVNQAELTEFREEAVKRLAWLQEAERKSSIMVLGCDTETAFVFWEEAKPSLVDYFNLDAAVAVDPAIRDEAAKIAVEAFKRAGADKPANIREAARAALTESPIAIPKGDGILKLQEVKNPLKKESITQCVDIAERLRNNGALAKGKGKPGLSRADFFLADRAFDDYREWRSREQGKRLAFLSPDYLRGLREENLYQSAEDLISERGAAALAAEDIRVVEQFLLYKKYLVKYLNNFVVFPYLYDPALRAAFEAGGFIADGRVFTFSVLVTDVEKHKISANYSHMHVLYLEVLKTGAPSYKVAVPVTTGAQGRLYKGKHGLFKEPDGTERDAIIIDILENPISVPETLSMPFRKAYKTVSRKLEEMGKKAEEKLAKSAADKADTALTRDIKPAAAEPAQQASPPPSPPPKPAVRGARTSTAASGAVGGLLAGGSIAVAALGSSVAFIGKTLSEMSLQAVLITIGSLVLAVLLPVLIAALSKLASRDLAPLLEASGIAINRRIRLSRAQAKAFTLAPRYINPRVKKRKSKSQNRKLRE